MVTVKVIRKTKTRGGGITSWVDLQGGKFRGETDEGVVKRRRSRLSCGLL